MWYTFSLFVIASTIGFPLYGICRLFDLRLDRETSNSWAPYIYSEEELKLRTPDTKPFRYKNEITFAIVSLFLSYVILMGRPDFVLDVWNFLY
jgi:hypothetical protein